MKTNNDLDKSISSDIPEDLTNNLKMLESKNNIKLFKKYNNILILRDINKIKDECYKMRKKYIIELSNDLKNLSNNIELDRIKEIQNKTNNNIHEIDNLMDIINNEYLTNYFTNIKQDIIFIEVYEN
jgi:hypothetical protein